MLTAAALGMAGYGVYSIVWAILAVAHGAPLALWAELALVVLGLLLLLSAAFVRVTLPGGLAFALGALLGVQAISIYNTAHLVGRVALGPEIARACFAALLLLMAWVGARRPHTE